MPKKAGFQLPPEFARAMAGLGAELSRVGGQVLAAGVARALEEVSKVTEEADRRIKRGARQATRVAHGEPFKPEEDE